MRQRVIETGKEPAMIHCNDLGELATLCAELFKQGITFVANTLHMTIELKGY